MKIFVSIVSYRDPLLRMTIDSLLDGKSGKHDIIIGVLEQIVFEDSLEAKDKDFVSLPHIKYKRIDPKFSDGVGWARHVNSLQVSDEDFIYQVDSHMLFDKNWDRKLINDWRKGREKHTSEKIIITGNCKNFDLDAEGNPIKQLEDKPLTCKVKYFDYNKDFDLLAAHGDHIDPTEDIEPAIHICAGNFFAPSCWIKEVGFDPYIFFAGEEQIMTLSSFAHGYHMYHPRTIHCYHFLGTHDYITKQNVKPVVPEHVIGQKIFKSHYYLRDYIGYLDETVLEKYRIYSGVDYVNATLEERAKNYTIVTATNQPSSDISPIISTIEEVVE